MDPFNQHVEFRDIVAKEDWPWENRPKGLWYFSGLLMDDEKETPAFTEHGYPKTQSDRVKYQCIQYLQASMGTLLPLATPVERVVPGDMFGFDFNLLNCPEEDTAPEPGRMGRRKKYGLDRFDSQFWRANIDPSERYVGCPRFNTRYRLRAWDSGFHNLVIAGDWIYTGLNVERAPIVVLARERGEPLDRTRSLGLSLRAEVARILPPCRARPGASRGRGRRNPEE